MKTLFKLTILVAVVGAVCAAFVFPEKVKLYAGTGKRLIQEKIDEAQGLETKLALLETKVYGLDREIVRLKTEVVRRQVDVEYLEDLINEKEESHGKLKKALEHASELLEENRETYRIGSRIYEHDDVSRDAAEKLKIYKIQSETLGNLKETLKTKRTTLDMARDNVTNAEGVKHELIAKVRFLKADLEKYKAKEVFAETVKSDDMAAEFKTEIGKTQQLLAEFEKQLEVKDRILDERIRVNGEYIGGIDYTSPKLMEDGDVAAEIQATLRITKKVAESGDL
jgi:chromosome segregation ATPase